MDRAKEGTGKVEPLQKTLQIQKLLALEILIYFYYKQTIYTLIDTLKFIFYENLLLMYVFYIEVVN